MAIPTTSLFLLLGLADDLGQLDRGAATLVLEGEDRAEGVFGQRHRHILARQLDCLGERELDGLLRLAVGRANRCVGRDGDHFRILR